MVFVIKTLSFISFFFLFLSVFVIHRIIITIIVNSSLHREAFTQAILADYPLAKVCIPQKDAADGALMMALNLCC